MFAQFFWWGPPSFAQGRAATTSHVHSKQMATIILQLPSNKGHWSLLSKSTPTLITWGLASSFAFYVGWRLLFWRGGIGNHLNSQQRTCSALFRTIEPESYSSCSTAPLTIISTLCFAHQAICWSLTKLDDDPQKPSHHPPPSGTHQTVITPIVIPKYVCPTTPTTRKH